MELSPPPPTHTHTLLHIFAGLTICCSIQNYRERTMITTDREANYLNNNSLLHVSLADEDEENDDDYERKLLNSKTFHRV